MTAILGNDSTVPDSNPLGANNKYRLVTQGALGTDSARAIPSANKAEVLLFCEDNLTWKGQCLEQLASLASTNMKTADYGIQHQAETDNELE